MIGRVLGTYKITDKLGEGGMGAVFRGVDIMVEREVAIKMLKPEIARQPEIVERFRAEAVTLAKLNHPCIATLYSFFRQGDEYFMVMEFVPGRALDAIIREQGRLAPERAAPIFVKTLEGIEHAHQMGILHRDIKPANIMITNAGQVKVTDFGIARVLGAARMTREGRLVGTLEYIAPERVRGEEADLRSDIYSLGAVLYEMLTGSIPFESASEFDLMKAHLEEPPPPFSKFGVTVPPALEAVVRQAMAKKPEDRFWTAESFRAALVNAVGAAPAGATGAWTGGPKPTRLATAAMPAAAPEAKATRLATPAQVAPPAAAAPSSLLSRLGWKIYAGAALALMLVAAIVFIAMRPAPAPPIKADTEQRENRTVTDQTSATDGQQAAEILKSAKPITGTIPALGGGAEAEKSAAPAAAERRKAALKALESAGEGPAGKKAEEESRRKRAEALKALEK